MLWRLVMRAYDKSTACGVILWKGVTKLILELLIDFLIATSLDSTATYVPTLCQSPCVLRS